MIPPSSQTPNPSESTDPRKLLTELGQRPAALSLKRLAQSGLRVQASASPPSGYAPAVERALEDLEFSPASSSGAPGRLALPAQFQVNTYTTSYQGNPAVGMNGDGDFVVV